MIKKLLAELKTNDYTKFSETTKYLLITLCTVISTLFVTYTYSCVRLITEKLEINSLVALVLQITAALIVSAIFYKNFIKTLIQMFLNINTDAANSNKANTPELQSKHETPYKTI